MYQFLKIKHTEPMESFKWAHLHFKISWDQNYPGNFLGIYRLDLQFIFVASFIEYGFNGGLLLVTGFETDVENALLARIAVLRSTFFGLHPLSYCDDLQRLSFHYNAHRELSGILCVLPSPGKVFLYKKRTPSVTGKQSNFYARLVLLKPARAV